MMNLKKVLLGLIFSFWICAAYTQEIHSVKFEQQGPFRYGEDLLRYNVVTAKGAVYDEKTVNEDIKRLHAVGSFSDVAAKTVRRGDGRMDVVFVLSVQPIIKEIQLRGNEKYTTKTLMEKIKLSAGEPLNNRKMQESLKELRKFYSEKGLRDAEIIPLPYVRTKDGQVIVRFNIKENLKYIVGGVTFDGATVFKKADLERVMRNQHSMFNWIPFLDLGLLDKAELENDLVRLRELYWTKGYLDFKVKETRLSADPKKPEIIHLQLILEEGKPYTVGKITLAGNKRFSDKEIQESMKLKSGEMFNSAKENASARDIEDRYAPFGYAEAGCRITRYPNYQTHKVDLAVNIQEGQPYTVRDVFISGNKWTKDHVIRRELAIAPDDPVDKHRIEASKNRLMGMGYFHQVQAVSVNSPEAQKKDVNFKVEEKNFLNGKIGAGFSDTDSLAGMFELTHSNMDILDPGNYFTGGGQRARLLAIYGIERYDFEADFTEPWLFGIPLRWNINGYIRNVDYENWSEQRIGGTTSLTKRIFDDFTSVTGSYTFEHVWVHDMRRDVTEMLSKESGGSFVGRIQMALDRDTRDNAFNPTSGYNINALGAVTTRILGASNDYYRFEMKAINYYSFFDKMFILSTGAKFGTIGTIGDPSKDPPIYERYFLGGGDSLRGFPYRTVGPKDANSDNYGGDFMYLVTAEMTHPIYEFIRGAVFVDMGDATHSRFGPFNSPNIGVGYGLRIRVPMINAPIKVDLAYPVLNNTGWVSNSLRIHFNMGFSVF